MELYGIRLVGINAENGQKVLMTFAFILGVYFLKKLISFAISKIFRDHENLKIRFWSRQGLNLISAVVILFSVLSIWFDDPTRLSTGLGLVTAGLAFALQKVVTSLAGYLMIMRGNTFNLGDRITMGGIRGDVIELNFLQTTIMEMGQPPSVQGADPAMWIKSRQFTGRIVTVTNDKVFENPVFNYTKDFPFLWEEITFPIKYTADRKKAEEILLGSVKMHIEDIHKLSSPVRANLDHKYGLKTDDMVPKVYCRLTDNWIELSVRFIVPEHGVRDIKDAISRTLLNAMEENQIEVASATFEIVGFPKLEIASSQRLGQKKISEEEARH